MRLWMSYISEAHCTCFCTLVKGHFYRETELPTLPPTLTPSHRLCYWETSEVWMCCVFLTAQWETQSLFCVFLLSSLDMQSSPHNQFTFRPLPPPPPPPHACTCARKPPPAADSLQRRSMTTRSQPSPAAFQLPQPVPRIRFICITAGSWTSNIPLETRYLSYDWSH